MWWQNLTSFTGTCNYSLPTWSPWLTHQFLASNKVILRIKPLLFGFAFVTGSMVLIRVNYPHHSMQV